MASVNQACNALSDNQNAQELAKLLGGMQRDLAAARTAITTLTAKLDADAGVTDVDYAATCDPAAQETTA